MFDCSGSIDSGSWKAWRKYAIRGVGQVLKLASIPIRGPHEHPSRVKPRIPLARLL